MAKLLAGFTSKQIERTPFLKTGVIALLMIIFQVIMSFLLYNMSYQTAYEGTFLSYQTANSALLSNFNECIESDLVDLENCVYEYKGVREGYKLKVDVRGIPGEYSIAESYYSSFTNTNKMVIVAHAEDLFAGEIPFNGTYVVYNDLVNNVYFKKLSSFDSLLKSSSFIGYTIVAPSGSIVQGQLFDNKEGVSILNDYNLERIELEGIECEIYVANDGQASRVLCLGSISSSQYSLGGFADFTAEKQALSELAKKQIIIAVACCLFTIVLFTIYSIWTGVTSMSTGFKYRIVTNPEGRIIYSNRAFKRDFPTVSQIRERVVCYSEDEYSTINLKVDDEEHILVCKIKKKSNATIKIAANLISLSFGVRTEEVSSDRMHGAYLRISKRAKRVLVGLIYVSNLPNIRAMFGAEFADDVMDCILTKCEGYFIDAFRRDSNTLGVVVYDNELIKTIERDVEDIITDLDQPVTIEQNVVTVGVRAGFSMVDETVTDRSFDNVFQTANGALKRCIELKLKNYDVYHESERKLYSKYLVKYDIKDMLERGMFELEYQPQYSVKEGRIVGFEALFRVRSEDVKINTFDLITYAERTGTMVMLGEFIFDTGMRFAKSIEHTNVTVSLNVSPIQLMQAGFVENFLSIYRKYDLKPGAISVEITESYLMSSFDETVKKLNILNEHGIEVHLDDFGTKYSSLLYLKNIPCQTIKVDREFIANITADEFCRSITSTVFDITNFLKLKCICEGVETREQLDVLCSLKDDVIIQGFIIGKSQKQEVARAMIGTFKLEDI